MQQTPLAHKLREELVRDCHENSEMKIILMRHGRPQCCKEPRLSAAEFGHWIARYDAAGLDPALAPPSTTRTLAQQCRYTVCSHLPRSTASAQALGVRQIDLQASDFREMELPHAPWSWPRLPAQVWTVIFRLRWLMGYSGGVESFSTARQRAYDAAKRLGELAQRHETVLFVGHGSLNWFIARYLKQAGWRSCGKSPKRYWEHCVFTRDECSRNSCPGGSG